MKRTTALSLAFISFAIAPWIGSPAHAHGNHRRWFGSPLQQPTPGPTASVPTPGSTARRPGGATP